MSVCSTRCIAALRLSVPESAWLTSSSVDRRRASRAAVEESGPERAAGISGLLHFWAAKPDSHENCRHSNPGATPLPRLRVLEPAAGGQSTLLFIRFCSNGDVTPRVCGFYTRLRTWPLYRITAQMRAFPPRRE